MKTTIATLALATLTACSGLVTSSSNEQVTLEHDLFTSQSALAQSATRACNQQGKSRAEKQSSVNKNPNLAPGTGVQLSTFRCI